MRRYLAVILLGILFGILACPFLSAQETAPEGIRKIERRVAPVYPELARKLNLNGVVKLRVTVAADGNARTSEVLGGNPVLAKSAQDAVLGWKWAPAAHESKEVVDMQFQH